VYREFDMPEIPEDGALIKVEIAGILRQRRQELLQAHSET